MIQAITDFQPIDIQEIDIVDADQESVSILMICDNDHVGNVVKDHIQAFVSCSVHNITTFNPLQLDHNWIINFDYYDVILLHYSIHILGKYFLSENIGEKIRNFSGLKVQIIGDEYRDVNEMVDKISYLGIHVLLSSLSPENISKVYGGAELKNTIKCSKLPGYVPENLIGLKLPPTTNRSLHITYRARELPFWLGEVGRMKNDIAYKFPEMLGDKFDLTFDVSAKESERIYGKKWIKFLCSSKAVLATEGGASIFDFDGRIEKEVLEYLKYHEGASYKQVAENVLYKYEGNVIHKTLTPRIFECVALKVALVMFPGEYSKILQPWRHFIQLEKDFSNASQVAELIKDDSYLQALTDRTYKEIIEPGSYNMKVFIQRFDSLIYMARQYFSESDFEKCNPPAPVITTRKHSRIKLKLLAALERAVGIFVTRYTRWRLNTNEWLTSKYYRWTR